MQNTFTVIVTIKEGVDLLPPMKKGGDFFQTFVVMPGQDPYDWNREIEEMLEVMHD